MTKKTRRSTYRKRSNNTRKKHRGGGGCFGGICSSNKAVAAEAPGSQNFAQVNPIMGSVPVLISPLSSSNQTQNIRDLYRRSLKTDINNYIKEENDFNIFLQQYKDAVKAGINKENLEKMIKDGVKLKNKLKLRKNLLEGNIARLKRISTNKQAHLSEFITPNEALVLQRVLYSNTSAKNRRNNHLKYKNQ